MKQQTLFSLMLVTDYIKFMCKAVVRGGGLFPWLIDNVSRALRWMWVTGATPQHSGH